MKDFPPFFSLNTKKVCDWFPYILAGPWPWWQGLTLLNQALLSSLKAVQAHVPLWWSNQTQTRNTDVDGLTIFICLFSTPRSFSKSIAATIVPPAGSTVVNSFHQRKLRRNSMNFEQGPDTNIQAISVRWPMQWAASRLHRLQEIRAEMRLNESWFYPVLYPLLDWGW